MPVPFSDDRTQKVRPALIVSGDRFNAAGDDVVICAITTAQSRSEPGFIISNDDLVEGTLINPGFVRVAAIHRVLKSRIIHRIARAKPQVREYVEREFKTLLRK